MHKKLFKIKNNLLTKIITIYKLNILKNKWNNKINKISKILKILKILKISNLTKIILKNKNLIC